MILIDLSASQHRGPARGEGQGCGEGRGRLFQRRAPLEAGPARVRAPPASPDARVTPEVERREEGLPKDNPGKEIGSGRPQTTTGSDPGENQKCSGTAHSRYVTLLSL